MSVRPLKIHDSGQRNMLKEHVSSCLFQEYIKLSMHNAQVLAGTILFNITPTIHVRITIEL